jgi:multidrug efflux pump subunit AcrB
VFGRTWQVNLQAETSFRDRIDDIYRFYVRNAQGGMVPMRALAERSPSRDRPVGRFSRPA